MIAIRGVRSALNTETVAICCILHHFVFSQYVVNLPLSSAARILHDGQRRSSLKAQSIGLSKMALNPYDQEIVEILQAHCRSTGQVLKGKTAENFLREGFSGLPTGKKGNTGKR